jgi:hypothetical protein
MSLQGALMSDWMNPNEPNPHSIRVMRAIDNMPAGMRTLAYEFGASIVSKMMDQGYSDPEALREILEERHERRQNELLR